MKKNQNKLKNSVDFYNELTWIRRQEKSFSLSKFYSLKLKKWIFREISKKKFNENENNKLLNNLENRSLGEIKSWKDILLISNVSNSRQFNDFKKNIISDKIFAKNKILLKKELDQKMKFLKKYEKKFEKLNNKKNFRKGRKLLIRINKLKIRIYDLNEFIKNKSIYRKVFLSDDPPLTKTGWIKLIFSYAILIFWVLIIIWPIYQLIVATLNDEAYNYINTSFYSFGFSSFERLFSETLFLNWLFNTLWIAGATSIITVMNTLLMGYAFSRFRFKGKKTSLLTVMLLQIIPTLAALTVFYVLFTLLSQTFSISGQLVLVIIYVGGGIAGNTFIMKGYMDSISKEIDEAAKIDGFSGWQIFTKIIIPLTKPIIALVALWSFIGPFGDYILPGLLLYEEETYTLAKGLRSLITDPTSVDEAAFAAGSILIAIPISVLFISLRGFLVDGMKSGGVKG